MDQDTVTPVCGVHIVRAPEPDQERFDVEAYVPERDADDVRHFACWKTPRGWEIFCFTFGVDVRSHYFAEQIKDFAPPRRPDVQGLWEHPSRAFRARAVLSGRGPYAASPADIRRIYRAIFAD